MNLGRQLALAMLLAGHLAAQAKVTAIVPAGSFAVGESFHFEIRVENGDAERLALAGIDDFRRLSGPSISRNMQIINNVVKSHTSYIWELMPRKAGTLTIPAQAVEVAGRVHHTQPVVLQVSKAPDLSASGAGSALYLQVAVEPREVYVGEQVTVTWTLFTQLGINGWESFAEPSLTGFWTENLFAPNNLQLREKFIGGKRYYFAVVRRAAIFATHSGELEVDPLVLRVSVQTQNRRRDPFFSEFSFFGRRSVENRTVSSAARTVTVLPLPSEGRPAAFAGAVGDFTIDGHMSAENLRQNEAVTLTLKISGEGNIKTLEPPHIDFPDGMEVFPPKSTVEAALGNVMGGTRTIEHVIIPRQAGRLVIPAIQLPFFNPRTKRYELADTGPFVLNVESTGEPALALEGFSRKEVALLGEDIRFLKTGSPRWFNAARGWYTRGILALNLLTALLFALPWLGGKAELYNRLVSPRLRAMRALSRAEAIIVPSGNSAADGATSPEESAAIYATFSQAVTVYLNAKTSRNDQEYSLAGADDLLKAAGIGQQERRQVARLLELAAAARFAPVPPSSAESDRQTLAEVLTAIDEQWG
ncbi:MAG: protein BatD [Candidatus Marinimicrobia bacterium]|nr:protein BatD [Candidatus Neomarinimicrobiota bacterium]